MPATAYSYVRFSTAAQLEGDSLRRQTDRAAKYAHDHGLTLDTELNMKDLGVSAYRGDNASTGALGTFLRAIEDGIVERGSYLLVESLDRLSRKVARKALRILEQIVEGGVTVVTLSDGKAYTEKSLDGMDFMWAMMIAMRAHEESAMKSDRIGAAWRAKRSRAATEVMTAVTPAWIKLDAKRKPVLIPERVKIVRRIVNAALSGAGKATIATDLNREGVATWGGGTRWHRSYINIILKSPALVGAFVPHTKTKVEGRTVRTPQAPVEGYFPPVVDADTYERLQALRKAAKASLPSPTRRRPGNVLSGLAKCPMCGGSMLRVSKAYKDRHMQYLVCSAAKFGQGCRYQSVPYDGILQAITSGVDRIIEDMPSPDVHLARELRNAEAALDAMTDKAEKLASVLERHPSETGAARLAAIEVDLKAARKERDELARRAAATETKSLRLRQDNLRRAAKSKPQDLARVNTALRELLASVTVDYKSGFLELNWRAGGTSNVFYGFPKK
jgi:DNA invertase Pin-like site-specific DNA recombinase